VLAGYLNPLHPHLALGTLAANLIGGYLVGVAVALLAYMPDVPPQVRLFVITGVLGGLTTFSTFSAETVGLLERGDFAWAGALVALHVCGSLAATVAGIAIVRRIAHAGGVAV
jgi:CrcB protein